MAVKKNKESCMNFSELDDVIGMENMIKAVEKQIPQEPRHQFVDVSEDSELMGWEQCSCPACNNQSLIYPQRYCQNCGQKINWGENKRVNAQQENNNA